VVELPNEGIDTIQSSVAAVLPVQVENLMLTGAADIAGAGNVLANVIIGNNGANRLDGGGNDDSLEGGGGADTLTGGSGNDAIGGGARADWLNGGGGADIMQGGAGNDTYVVERGSDVVIEQASGGISDTIRSSVSYQLPANVEALVLKGSSNIRGTGNGLDNNLTGNSGGNVLNGGAGSDSLTGGAGQDTFVFDSALDATTNADTIADFSAADDLIRLDDDVFAALSTGRLPARAWHNGAGVTTAHDHTDRLIYDNSTGNLYYDPDGTGAQAATLFATLANTPAIAAADFFVVA
jgi:Ca2+-binding RTX toxin-like protein